jgi:hypothetical protein
VRFAASAYFSSISPESAGEIVEIVKIQIEKAGLSPL